mgnify:CR=1 FL=1
MAAKLMTKSQLAAHIAEKFSLSKKAANDVIDEFASIAVAQTKKVGAFTLPGLGKLAEERRDQHIAETENLCEEMKALAKAHEQLSTKPPIFADTDKEISP